MTVMPQNNPNKIVLLSHSDTDLITLAKVVELLPNNFPEIQGYNLQSFHEDITKLDAILTKANLVIVRLLGNLESINNFKTLLENLKDKGKHLIVLSGCLEFNPEFNYLNPNDYSIVQSVNSYFQAGGLNNMIQLFKFLSDKLYCSEYGYLQAENIPMHGFYYPQYSSNDFDFDVFRKIKRYKATVLIVFYRAHYVSGNVDFINQLVDKLNKIGLDALPVFTASLSVVDKDFKIPLALKFLGENPDNIVDIIINTTSFSVAKLSANSLDVKSDNYQSLFNIPVLQAIISSMDIKEWQNSARGLNPLDTAMNVVIPEFDGRIITKPIACKEKQQHINLEFSLHKAIDDRIDAVCKLAKKYCNLKHKDNTNKKIAFIFTNSSAKAAQIGNAVGLDSAASLINILKAMEKSNYNVGQFPHTGTQMLQQLIESGSYDTEILTQEQYSKALGNVSLPLYQSWFNELPLKLQNDMIEQWGLPPGTAYHYQDSLMVAGLSFGNMAILLQPPRGYGMDQDAIYHKPDLPPTHHYLAVYRWLKEIFQADAIIHMGKHGTLEWLPGKGVGLSNNCFPDAVLADLPLFYPFIINDPGEGCQAKRRSHAAIVDHMMPAMTTADTYGSMAELVQLIDEYYQLELLDPTKLPALQQQIYDLIQQANLEYDLEVLLAAELNELNQESVISTNLELKLNDTNIKSQLEKLNSVKFSHLIQEIDGYLCELGLAQIRSGLHTLGVAPCGNDLVDTLYSLTRLPNIDISSLQAKLAQYFNFDLNELLTQKGNKITNRSNHVTTLAGKNIVTYSDALETIDKLGHDLIYELMLNNFTLNSINLCINKILPRADDENKLISSEIHSILEYICLNIYPNILNCSLEIDNLLKGLNGQFIPPGPSGAPTRGMVHILPTGRNFYSVDPNTLPSMSSWQTGQFMADKVIQRYYTDTGEYPKTISISIWGTSVMRTHGDDIAQVLALMGVRPVWQKENRRLISLEVIPLVELKRPRIDVTTRISGFFRDAFGNLISLLAKAVNIVIEQDEPLNLNYIRANYLAELSSYIALGMPEIQAKAKAAYRIFGSKPGSYGAGILPLIQEKNWQNCDDFAKVYINWGGYAYSHEDFGQEAFDIYSLRLKNTQIALHNQDNREHDIFDSDDYFQYHGGMIATIKSLSGKTPMSYFGDSQNPQNVKVNDLKQEVNKVFRTRVINPKWLDSILKHGYRGGVELNATIDYLFGYDATANVLEDWMYEAVAQNYVQAKEIQEFFRVNNPWALMAIAQRLLEAIDRGMWVNPSKETIEELKQIYLHTEDQLEASNNK